MKNSTFTRLYACHMSAQSDLPGQEVYFFFKADILLWWRHTMWIITINYN